jgi:OOP family OmpA-OmpF porin
VWVSRKVGGRWDTPVNLGSVVNSPQDEYPRWISDDGKTLVFASRRSGGYGGADLWYTTKVGGEWQTPVNFGPVINTSADEWGASFKCHRGVVGGIIFFGSGRPGGQGGWDLWQSTDDAYHAVEPASFGRVKAVFE